MIDKNWLMVIRINLIMFGKTINNIIGVVTIAVWAVGSMTVSINQYHYIWKCECSYCMLFSTTTALHNGPAVLFGNGCLGFTIVWICGDMNEGTDVSLRPVKNTFCELHLWEKTWFLNKLKTNSERSRTFHFDRTVLRVGMLPTASPNTRNELGSLSPQTERNHLNLVFNIGKFSLDKQEHPLSLLQMGIIMVQVLWWFLRTRCLEQCAGEAQKDEW